MGRNAINLTRFVNESVNPFPCFRANWNHALSPKLKGIAVNYLTPEILSTYVVHYLKKVTGMAAGPVMPVGPVGPVGQWW